MARQRPVQKAGDIRPPRRLVVDCVYHGTMPTGYTLAAAFCMALSLAGAQNPTLQHAPITTFGVTVVDPFGLRGDIYLLKPDTDRLPKFEKLKPVGAIYTSSLNIPPRDFKDGFPGVTNRFEWFAIDYTGNFYIADPGRYLFLLSSDDGHPDPS